MQDFEKAAVKLCKQVRLLGSPQHSLMVDNARKLLAYGKKDLIFAFNFHPTRSYEGYQIPVTEAGDYQVVLSTDDFRFGGQGRVHHLTYRAEIQPDGRLGFKLYLPNRTAVVLKKLSAKKKQ